MISCLPAFHHCPTKFHSKNEGIEKSCGENLASMEVMCAVCMCCTEISQQRWTIQRCLFPFQSAHSERWSSKAWTGCIADQKKAERMKSKANQVTRNLRKWKPEQCLKSRQRNSNQDKALSANCVCVCVCVCETMVWVTKIHIFRAKRHLWEARMFSLTVSKAWLWLKTWC